LISKEGILLGAFGVIGIWAYTKHHIILALLTSYMFIGLLVIALLWAVIASIGVKARRKMPGRALWGEKVPIEIELHTSNRVPLFHVRVWDRARRGDLEAPNTIKNFLTSEYFSGEEFISWLRLSRRNKVAETKRTIFNERGLFHIGPMIVEGRDPLGIFRIRRMLPIFDEILIMPGWFRIQQFPVSGVSRLPRELAMTIPREGASPDFLGVREYSDGDSLRRVHWPLTAKHNKIIVRQFQKEVESELAVILDMQRGRNAGFGRESSLGAMLEIALSLIKYNIDMGFPYAAAFTTEEGIIYESELKHDIFPNILERAAVMLDDGRSGMEDALSGLVRRFRGMSLAVVSSRTDDVIFNVMHGMAAHDVKVTYICVDAASYGEEKQSKERLDEITKLKSFVPDGWRFYYVRKEEDLKVLFS
jgi:hypothetical protein